MERSGTLSPRRRSRRLPLLAAAVVCALFVTTLVIGAGGGDDVGAFGSVDSSVLGQKPVHEGITRTLGCAANDPVVDCFEPRSLDLLAGRSGTWGAVAQPDNPLDGFPNPAARHCDDVDQGYGSPRTSAEAQAAFDACLDWYQSYLDAAVEGAAGLLLADGTIDPSAISIVDPLGGLGSVCSFPDPKKAPVTNDSAKCRVIGGLGRALHAYEDVWSHSNWGDLADPSVAQGVTSPVGLGRTEQPSFMSYPGSRSVPIPQGYLTGCDDSVPLVNQCAGGTTNARTGHSVVNKDNGTVDPTACVGSAPLSTRGKVIVDGTSNFQRAITGACGAARSAWSDLRAALVSRYGAAAAATMIRAITVDHPFTNCRIGGAAARADAPPVGDVASARSATIVLVDATSSSMSCGTAKLDGGEWASYPPDTIAAGATATWRTQSNGMATGTAGSVDFAMSPGAGTATVTWSVPYWGSNSVTCTAPAGVTCTVSDASGNGPTVTVTFTGP